MSDVAPATVMRWIVALAVVLCLVALLAYVRGKPGDGGRDPGPDAASAAAALVVRG